MEDSSSSSPSDEDFPVDRDGLIDVKTLQGELCGERALDLLAIFTIDQDGHVRLLAVDPYDMRKRTPRVDSDMRQQYVSRQNLRIPLAARRKSSSTQLMAACVHRILKGAAIDVYPTARRGTKDSESHSKPKKFKMTPIQAKLLMETLDETGMTITHWATTYNMSEMLKLILDAGFDLASQNSKGQTILDVARTRGNTESEEVILAKEAGLSNTCSPVADDSVLGLISRHCTRSITFPGLEVYIPTKGGHISATQLLQLIPRLKQVNQGVMEYPKSATHAPDPKIVPKDGREKGTEAEKKVCQTLKNSLERVQKQPEHENWRFYIFKNLPIFKHGYEGELDLCIMAVNLNDDRCSAMLVEVKATDKPANVLEADKKGQLRGVAKKAGLQLKTAAQALQDKIQVEFPWLQSCIVAFPNASNSAVGQGRTEWEEIEVGNPANSTGDTIRLVFNPLLDDEIKLDAYLQETLVDKATINNNFGDLLYAMTLLSYGQEVKVSHDSCEKHTVALLMQQQKCLIDNITAGKARRLLVLGGSGTGKTFIALIALAELKKSGKISAENKAAYVVPDRCTALLSWLEKQLTILELSNAVELMTLKTDLWWASDLSDDDEEARLEGDDLELIYENVLNIRSFPYVFVDQAETMTVRLSRYRPSTPSSTPTLIVLLWNSEFHVGKFKARIPPPPHLFLEPCFKVRPLDTRIRLSTTHANFLDRHFRLRSLSNPAFLDSFPKDVLNIRRSLAPAPRSSQDQPGGVHYITASRKQEIPSLQARAVWHVITEWGIDLEDICIIRPTDVPNWDVAFRKQLKSCGFKRIKRTNPTDKDSKVEIEIDRAPIIVRSPILSLTSEESKGVAPHATLSEIIKMNISKVKEASKSTDPAKCQSDALKELVAELESNRSGPGSHFESSWQKPIALVQTLASEILEKFRSCSSLAEDDLNELFAWERNMNHYMYISVLDEEAVEGYEAPVVIGSSEYDLEVINPSKLVGVSRALMHSILIVYKPAFVREEYYTRTMNRLGAKHLTLPPDVPP